MTPRLRREGPGRTARKVRGNGVECRIEHRGRQAPGIGVVAATVVAVDQQPGAFQRMRRAVREREGRRVLRERAQCRFMGDASQRQDRAALRHRRQVRSEIAIAGADLGGQRLVSRRQTLDGVGDPAVDETQSVVACAGDWLRRESMRIQRLVEQDTGVIARERPARRIGAVHAGCQADDEQPRGRVAKGWHGSAPIIRMQESHLGQECIEPRTATTRRIVGCGSIRNVAIWHNRPLFICRHGVVRFAAASGYGQSVSMPPC